MSLEKQRRTFLSYSRINKDFALSLAKELKSAGFPLWIDQLDIPTGARWDDELEKALDACEIFMVILTPASISSENVKDEIGYAIDHGKRILPVLLETSKIPLRLRRFQYVDFTTKSFDEGIESAKQLLKNLIDEPTVPIPSMVSDTQEEDRQAEAARKAKKEANRVAEQKAEEKRRVQSAKAKSTPPAPKLQQKAEAVSTAPSSKKPLSKQTIIGIGAAVIIVLAIIIGSALSGGDDLPTTPSETKQPTSLPTATQEVQPSNTPEPTIVPDTPTPEPTPTFAPPVTPYVRILEITIDTQLNYVVEYETFGYTEELPGTHIHFFFDTVTPEQAGVPGSGPWVLYGGPRPFTQYAVPQRPANAMQMCALVANSNHRVQPDSGNCVDLP